MPAMKWLGFVWRVGTDDMAVPAGIIAACRVGLGVVTCLILWWADNGGRLDQCKAKLTLWAGSLLLIYLCSIGLEIAIMCYARGAILHGAAARQKTVPPLLTAHLALTVLESGCAVWGVIIAIGRGSQCGVSALGESRAATQHVVAWAEVGLIVGGAVVLWLLLGRRLPRSPDDEVDPVDSQQTSLGGAASSLEIALGAQRIGSQHLGSLRLDSLRVWSARLWSQRSRHDSASLKPSASHTRFVQRVCCCVPGVDADAQEVIATHLARLLPAELDLTV